MSRPYRIVNGVAYTELVKKNSTTRVTANLDDREEYYYDPALVLCENDVRNLAGKPICVEHDQNDVVGEITKTWTDPDGKLRFLGRVYLDTKYGQQIDRDIHNGVLRGISVGYDSLVEDGHVVGKNFHEVSLCREGFFSGATVSTTASKTGNTKYKSSKKIYFQISASKQDKMNPETEVVIPVSDASELAKQTDEMLKRNDELEAERKAKEALLLEKEAKNKELLEKLAVFEKQEAERLATEKAEQERIQAEYAKANAPELEKQLAINRQQYKDIHGEDAELPEAYVNDISSAFQNKQAEPHFQAITASRVAYERKAEQAAALQKQVEEMTAKMKKLEEVNAVGQVHVKANRDRILKAKEEEQETVNVSAAAGFSQMFKLNDLEKDIVQQDYPHLFQSGGSTTGTVGVTASAADTRVVPTHAHLKNIRGGGMRKHCPALFKVLVFNDSGNNPDNITGQTLNIGGKDISVTH